jgi:phosphatidylglycerophosphate synthase
VLLFVWEFPNNEAWATALFLVAMATDQIDGWLARRRNQTSSLGSLLDPIADKILVLAMLVMLIERASPPRGWSPGSSHESSSSPGCGWRRSSAGS